MKHNRPLLLLALLLGALIAACAPSPTAAPTTAPAAPTAAPAAALKGELNVMCTPQQEWCEGMKKEFETKNPGVTVNFIRLSSGESLTRLRNEKANPQFDIWWGGPIDSFIAAKKEGLLDPYKTAGQANIIDPKLMLDPDNQWVGIYVGSLGFATNTKQSAIKPPTSLDDLIKPELKGQIVIAHPASSGTSYTFLCTVLQIKGAQPGWDYIKKFGQNVLLWTKSGAGPVQNVGKGEAAVGVVFSHDIVAGIETGLPLALTFPSEGTGYEIGGMGIIKGAKHPDLAKAWYDWAIQPATQELGKKYHAYQGLTVKGATPPKPELLSVKLINYDFDYCGNNKTAFVDKFSNEIAAASLAK
ncbi:MAG: ABC transporter substrate-binding protein [Chloroflexi bacterium]|nr:ABC transporter substrate-binding protein [Chloroflexota bacterium]